MAIVIVVVEVLVVVVAIAVVVVEVVKVVVGIVVVVAVGVLVVEVDPHGTRISQTTNRLERQIASTQVPSYLDIRTQSFSSPLV